MEWSGRLEEVSPSALAPRGRGQAWLNPPRKQAFSIKKSEFLLGKNANWWYLEWNLSWYFYWATHIDSYGDLRTIGNYSPQLWPFVPGNLALQRTFRRVSSPGPHQSGRATAGRARLGVPCCGQRVVLAAVVKGGQGLGVEGGGGRLIFVLIFVKPPSVLSTYTHCIPKPLSTESFDPWM